MSDFGTLAEQRPVRKQRGQNLVEYAMLVALIALVAAVGVLLFGEDVDAFFGGLVSDGSSESERGGGDGGGSIPLGSGGGDGVGFPTPSG